MEFWRGGGIRPPPEPSRIQYAGADRVKIGTIYQELAILKLFGKLMNELMNEWMIELIVLFIEELALLKICCNKNLLHK